MKRVTLNFLILTSLLSIPSVATAQTNGIVQRVNVPYVLPQSGIKVTLKVAHEKIEKGPYAKYAQQLLGVVAPLSDRSSYEITSGILNSYSEGDVSNIYMISDTKATPLEVVGMEFEFDNAENTTFNKEYSKSNTPTFYDLSITPIVYQSISADKSSSREKSLDDMAYDAANTIFTLRKRRFDLITGESSDNAFGAGLGAAIEEMKRIEEEYVALFVGKKTIIVKEFVFDVIPEKNKENYVVCRFTKDMGIVDAMDVSGEPILLTVTPENRVKERASEQNKNKNVITYRAADMAECKLFNSQSLLEVRRLPIFQFGTDIQVVPSK